MTPASLVEPDDAVVAWRYWQLAPVGGRGPVRLRSVSQRRFWWEPGTPLRAVCTGGGHPAPAPACGCGIYGARDLDHLRQHGLCLSPGGLAVGRVRLWGRVLPAESGYRAEHAYPDHVSIVAETLEGVTPAEAAAELGSYRCPVDFVALGDVVGDVSGAQLAFQAMALRAARTPPRD